MDSTRTTTPLCLVSREMFVHACLHYDFRPFMVDA